MKIVNEDDNRTKLGMEVLPRGVLKRKLNPNELGYKMYRSRNKKRCSICNSYDDVISEQIVLFGYVTLSFICIMCRKK